MTSQGSPYARLRRALETTRSPSTIRDAASELGQVGLEDALDICLGLLEREPACYARAAARWAARLMIEHALDLRDAHLTLAALGALDGASPRAGAEALIELCHRHGLRRCDEVIGAWMSRRGIEA